MRIRETCGPGAVSRATAITDNGTEVTLWEGQDPTRQGPTDFVVKPPQPVVAGKVNVYLQTESVPGWNEIDAVEVVSTDGRRQWATEASASSHYGQPAPAGAATAKF